MFFKHRAHGLRLLARRCRQIRLHIRRRWRRRRAAELVENPGAAHYRRSPVAIRGMQQHGTLAEKTMAILVLEAYTAELCATYGVDAVVSGQPFIEERIVGPQQLFHVLVLKQNAPQEEVDFGREILSQLYIEVGRRSACPIRLVDHREGRASGAQNPLQATRPGGAASNCAAPGRPRCGMSQLALFARLSSSSSGPASTRRKTDARPVPDRSADRISFLPRQGNSAIEKIRAYQNRSDQVLDPGVESASPFMAGVVKGHQPV